ncbi:hypothetical protein ACV229_09115 [Burkholderia sp. MR1-5-21]
MKQRRRSRTEKACAASGGRCIVNYRNRAEDAVPAARFDIDLFAARLAQASASAAAQHSALLSFGQSARVRPPLLPMDVLDAHRERHTPFHVG